MEQRWLKISAKDQKLGRLATKVATLLMGKDLPSYESNQEASTHVVVTDCDSVNVPENRLKEDIYHHTGYLGNIKKTTRAEMNKTEVVRKSISGMLPKNKTRRSLLKHLHCQSDQNHPYKQHINE